MSRTPAAFDEACRREFAQLTAVKKSVVAEASECSECNGKKYEETHAHETPDRLFLRLFLNTYIPKDTARLLWKRRQDPQDPGNAGSCSGSLM